MFSPSLSIHLLLSGIVFSKLRVVLIVSFHNCELDWFTPLIHIKSFGNDNEENDGEDVEDLNQGGRHVI